MSALQNLIRWFLPSEDHFFEYINESAEAAHQSALLFAELSQAVGRDAQLVLVERIREAEHAADRSFKKMCDALDSTFVTPIDREDLYHLSSATEDVSDFISATANQLTVHQMDVLPEGSRELASLLVKAVAEFKGAVAQLGNGKSNENIRAACRSIGYIEHEADVIFRLRLGDLFAREKDAIQLIKHKEFLEGLEDSIDRAAGAGTVIEAVCIKHA